MRKRINLKISGVSMMTPSSAYSLESAFFPYNTLYFGKAICVRSSYRANDVYLGHIREFEILL